MADHIANFSYEANINPIPEESLAGDETIIGVLPGGKEGLNPIPEESSAGDETIIGVFPGGIESMSNPILEDETIVGVFPGFPSPEESYAGNETIIGVFPGGNDETNENPSIESYPSFEESPSSTNYKRPSQGDEGIVIIPGVVPQEWSRKQPTKRAINKGIPGGTH